MAAQRWGNVSQLITVWIDGRVRSVIALLDQTAGSDSKNRSFPAGKQ